jgi:hypothetical protein
MMETKRIDRDSGSKITRPQERLIVTQIIVIFFLFILTRCGRLGS